MLEDFISSLPTFDRTLCAQEFRTGASILRAEMVGNNDLVSTRVVTQKFQER